MTGLDEKFNKNIRPLLDAVDMLRNLKVTDEGIPLPSIVVVGDQSSGKSSVLESLATISLPRGQGIATRVPLVLRLQSCRGSEDSAITISYKDKQFTIKEEQIVSQVNAATDVLAGTGKGVVTDASISLHIRRPNAPDLTMIDLPGITRVPVHGQPADIYEQIKAMIQKYLKPQETVILNVLSATVDFSTCESIRMSQEVDKNGERTLAVVTKVDRAADDVYDKVMADDVNIGLGYICVRNRTGDGSHEEAREQERELFRSHTSLSRLDKSSVGIPSLAERLTQIQANIIRASLPGIQQKVDKALLERRRELEALPQGSLANADPTVMFLNIVEEIKTTMDEILLNGNYDKVSDQKQLHYPARLDEMFQAFSDKLHDVVDEILPASRTAEILLLLTEMRGLSLPNFLSPALMRTLVKQEIDKVSEACTDLVAESHEFARNFVFNIVQKSANMFPNLHAAYKQARLITYIVILLLGFVHSPVISLSSWLFPPDGSLTALLQEADNVLAVCRRKCTKYVLCVLDKERSNVCTMNDYYMANVQKIREHLIQYQTGRTTAHQVQVEGFKQLFSLNEAYNASNEYRSAFDMKVNLAAYCKVVHKRMADEIPLELRFALQNTLLRNLREAMLKAKLGQDLSTVMEENPATLHKRLCLRQRIDTLRKCKGVLQKLL